MEPQKIAELAAKGGSKTCNCRSKTANKRPRPKCDLCKGTGSIRICSTCKGAGYDGEARGKCAGCNGTGLL